MGKQFWHPVVGTQLNRCTDLNDLFRMSTWGRCRSTHVSPFPPQITLSVFCIKHCTEMKSKCSVKASGMTHPAPGFFPWTPPCQLRVLRFTCPPQTTTPATPLLFTGTQIREGGLQANRGRQTRHRLKTNLFPKLTRASSETHQRAPLEPLKPQFLNMKESYQNRAMKKGKELQEGRLICLLWGKTQRGFHPQTTAACLSLRSLMWEIENRHRQK